MAAKRGRLPKKKIDKDRTFKTWCYRIMHKIIWTNMVSNENVLERISVENILWSVSRK